MRSLPEQSISVYDTAMCNVGSVCLLCVRPEGCSGMTNGASYYMPGGRSMATFGSSYSNAGRCILWQGSPIFKDWGCRLSHSTTVDIHLCPNDLSTESTYICLANDLYDKMRMTETGSINPLSSGSSCYSPLRYIDRPRRCPGLMTVS